MTICLHPYTEWEADPPFTTSELAKMAKPKRAKQGRRIDSYWRDAHPSPVAAEHRALFAVKNGWIDKADHCEVCDKTETEIRANIATKRGTCRTKITVIFGHHWNGYDNSADVWWVCQECNAMLWGRHDGSLTLEQARDMKRRQTQIEVKEIVLAGGRIFKTDWLVQLWGADFSKA